MIYGSFVVKLNKISSAGPTPKFSIEIDKDTVSPYSMIESSFVEISISFIIKYGPSGIMTVTVWILVIRSYAVTVKIISPGSVGGFINSYVTLPDAAV